MGEKCQVCMSKENVKLRPVKYCWKGITEHIGVDLCNNCFEKQEISPEGLRPQWMKNAEEIEKTLEDVEVTGLSSKYRIKCKGPREEITFDKDYFDDTGAEELIKIIASKCL